MAKNGKTEVDIEGMTTVEILEILVEGLKAITAGIESLGETLEELVEKVDNLNLTDDDGFSYDD
jgi:hypothetical protein